MIKEPTHILDTSSSCIDLIFRSQPNLIIESGVHSFRVNLEIVYSPPYVREVWHYKDGNTKLVRGTSNEFNWQRAF